MEDLTTILGLIGVTLLLSVGKWLGGLREWLVGFTVWINPLRILGETLSCTISTGFLVGASWGLLRVEPWADVLVWGGLISLLTYVADEVLALMDAGVRKLMGRGSAMPPMPLPIKREEKAPVTNTPRPLSEEEAHAMVGGKDDLDE